MSILETFYIMFGSNAEELKKGAADAEQATNKLEAAVERNGEKGEHSANKIHEAHSRLGEGIEELKDKFKEFGDSVIEQSLEIGAAFQAVFELEKLVDNFFETAEKSDQLGEQAKSLGVNVEQLDQWGQAVRRVGGTAEGFGQSLRSMNSNLERIAITGHSRALPFFQQMGISVRDATGHVKSAFDLLPELADKFQNMPKSQSGAMGRAIGLDEGTIRLLQAGGKEVDELIARQKELGSITQEDAETAERFNREWMDVQEIFRNLTVAADTALLPALQFILEGVEAVIQFLREHKDFAVGALIALGATALWAAGTFGLLDAALAVLTSPITLLIAAIVAIGLAFAFVYDDIANFLEGNNSIIGDLAKRWPIVGEVIQKLAAIVSDVWQVFVSFFDDVKERMKAIPEGIRQWSEIFDWIGAYVQTHIIDKLIEIFNSLPGPLKEIISDVGNYYKTVFGAIPDAARLAWAVIVESAKRGVEVLKAVFDLIGDAFTNPEHAFENFGAAMTKIFGEIKADLPGLGNAFHAVADDFVAIGNMIMKVFNDILATVTGTIDKITGAAGAISHGASSVYNAIRHPFGGGGGGSGTSGQPGASGAPAPLPSAVADNVAAGQATLGNIGAGAGLMSQTSSSIATSARTANNNVTINGGPVTINTQSGDPAAIKQEFDKHLADQYTDYMNTHLADGMAY